MLWILLALLAPLLWACGNVIDGDLIRHRIKNANAILAVTGLFHGIPLFYLAISGQLAHISLSMAAFGILTGVLSLFAYYPYYRALETTHPANAILLWNLSPVLIAVLAFLFLGERLTLFQYIAILALVMSAIVVQASKKNNNANQKAIAWMLIASMMTAIQVIMEKRLFMATSQSLGIAAISAGSFLSGLLLLASPRTRSVFKNMLTANRTILVGNQLLDVLASVCFSLAISLGPVTLVTAIGGIQALFILALGWLAMRIFSKKQLQLTQNPPLRKIVLAVMLTVIGLAMI